MNGLIRSMIARCHSSPSLYLTATLAARLWIAFETCRVISKNSSSTGNPLKTRTRYTLR